MTVHKPRVENGACTGSTGNVSLFCTKTWKRGGSHYEGRMRCTKSVWFQQIFFVVLPLILCDLCSADDTARSSTVTMIESVSELETFMKANRCGEFANVKEGDYGSICIYGLFESPDTHYSKAFVSVAKMLERYGTTDFAFATAFGSDAASLVSNKADMPELAFPSLVAHLPFQYDAGLSLAESPPLPQLPSKSQWRFSDSGTKNPTLPRLGETLRLKKRMRHILNFIYSEALEPILFYPQQPRAKLALRLSSFPIVGVPYGKLSALSKDVYSKLVALGRHFRGKLHVLAIDLNDPTGEGDKLRQDLHLRKQKSGFKLIYFDPAKSWLAKYYSLSNGLALSALRSWLGNPLSEHPHVQHSLPGFSKKKKFKIKKKRKRNRKSDL